MVRYVAPLVVFALLVLVFIKGLDPDRDLNALPSPFLGNPAPQFDLPTLKDSAARIASKDIDGKLALVNVWATWCVGCRQEHDFLMQLSRQNILPIYGINWRDRRDEALQWLTK